MHVGHALACSEIAATCNYDNNRQLSFQNHSYCTEKITKSSEPAQIKADEEARLQQLEEQSGCKGKSTAWTESWCFGSMFFLFQEAFFRFQPFVFGGCKSLSTVFVCISYFCQSYWQLEMKNLWKDTEPFKQLVHSVSPKKLLKKNSMKIKITKRFI